MYLGSSIPSPPAVVVVPMVPSVDRTATTSTIIRHQRCIRRGPARLRPPPGPSLGQLHLLAVAQPLDDARVALDDRRRFAGASGAALPPSSGPPASGPAPSGAATMAVAATTVCGGPATPVVSVLSGSLVESIVDTSEKNTALDSSESAPAPPPGEQSSDSRPTRRNVPIVRFFVQSESVKESLQLRQTVRARPLLLELVMIAIAIAIAITLPLSLPITITIAITLPSLAMIAAIRSHTLSTAPLRRLAAVPVAIANVTLRPQDRPSVVLQRATRASACTRATATRSEARTGRGRRVAYGRLTPTAVLEPQTLLPLERTQRWAEIELLLLWLLMQLLLCPEEPPESRLNELPERFERLPRLQQLSASECGEWRLLCECRSGSDLWLLMLYDCVGE
uniref:Uncharacterized protein n=1 Tax=Anopheles atroparvus TaxID=41427 RepID=A0A182J7E4_ANOAO